MSEVKLTQEECDKIESSLKKIVNERAEIMDTINNYRIAHHFPKDLTPTMDKCLNNNWFHVYALLEQIENYIGSLEHDLARLQIRMKGVITDTKTNPSLELTETLADVVKNHNLNKEITPVDPVNMSEVDEETLLNKVIERCGKEKAELLHKYADNLSNIFLGEAENAIIKGLFRRIYFADIVFKTTGIQLMEDETSDR